MASNFPASLDTGSTTLRDDIQSNDDLNTAGKEHDVMHVNVNDSSIELQKKVGITASLPTTADHVLKVTGSGTTAWGAITSVGTLSALTVSGAVTAGSLVAPIAINAQTGTTYTFVAADAGKLVTSSNGSAQTITIPPNSSVAFDIGTQIMVQNIGSANATLAQGSGVTIQSKDSAKEIDGQFAAATCIKTATDTWTLIGALA